MKKYIASFCLVLSLALLLSGCGDPKCDGCEKRITGTETVIEVAGKTYHYCEPCYAGIQKINDILN